MHKNTVIWESFYSFMNMYTIPEKMEPVFTKFRKLTQEKLSLEHEGRPHTVNMLTKELDEPLPDIFGDGSNPMFRFTPAENPFLTEIWNWVIEVRQKTITARTSRRIISSKIWSSILEEQKHSHPATLPSF